MMFLAISAVFEFLCVFLYAYVFPKLPIVKYYRSKAASEGSKTVSANLAAGGIQTESSKVNEEDSPQVGCFSNKELFLQNIDYAIGLFLIYVLTLSIFPGFLFEDTGSHSLGSWYALVLVTTNNFSDLVGRYIPVVEFLKLESRKGHLKVTRDRNKMPWEICFVCLILGLFSGVTLDWMWFIGKGSNTTVQLGCSWTMSSINHSYIHELGDSPDLLRFP